MTLATDTPPAAPKRTLFDIGEDFEALEKLLAECDGDISDPAAIGAVEAWIAELKRDQARKADAYVAVIQKWETEAALAMAEADRFSKMAADARKRAGVKGNRVDTLTTRVKEFMLQTNQRVIETINGRTLTVQKNGGKVPLHVNEDVKPDTLPKRFQKIVIELNAEEVRLACEVAGAAAEKCTTVGLAMEHLSQYPAEDLRREAKVFGIDLQNPTITDLQRLIVHMAVPFAHLGQRGMQLRIR